MSIIDEALQANARLAENYDASHSGKPAPKIAVVTCADPRLSGIIRLMGLPDADVDLIRNVGTVVDDDVIRSLIISTRLLGTREIAIINHKDCGLSTFSGDELQQQLRKETGVSPIVPATFASFTDAEQNTREQVERVRSHPWIASDIPVRGFLFDEGTGRLSEVSTESVASSTR